MKMIKTFITTFAIVLTGSMISCESVTNPDSIPAIDSTQTATIEGTVYANLDETNDTTFTQEENYERAPQGTTVKVVLDAGEFGNSAATGNTLAYTTEVDGSGNYQIEVPAQSEPINAEIQFDSFVETQMQADSSQQEATFEPVQFPYNEQITADFQSFQDAFFQTN